MPDAFHFDVGRRLFNENEFALLSLSGSETCSNMRLCDLQPIAFEFHHAYSTNETKRVILRSDL